MTVGGFRNSKALARVPAASFGFVTLTVPGLPVTVPPATVQSNCVDEKFVMGAQLTPATEVVIPDTKLFPRMRTAVLVEPEPYGGEMEVTVATGV